MNLSNKKCARGIISSIFRVKKLYKHQTGNHQTVIILTFNFLTYQNHLQYTKFPKFDSEKLLKTTIALHETISCCWDGKFSPLNLQGVTLSNNKEQVCNRKASITGELTNRIWKLVLEKDDPLLFGVSAYFLVRRVSFRECSDSWTFTLSIIYNKITTRWTQKLSYQ